MSARSEHPHAPRRARADDDGRLPARTPSPLARPLVARGARRRGFGTALAELSSTLTPRLVRLDPTRVGGAIDTKHWSSRHRRAAVLDGDWDLARVTRPIIERTIAQLASGVPPTETEQYRHMLALIDRGSTEWNYHCTTEEEVHAYFERLVQAWEAIRAGDYRTQEQLGGQPGDEIEVHVGRDGTILIGQYGNHRLVMARTAGLRAVPMQVRTLHARWARWCWDRHGPPLQEALLQGLADRGARALG